MHTASVAYFFSTFFFFKSKQGTIAFISLRISLYFFLFCFRSPLLNLNQWEFDDATEHVSSFGLLCQNRSQMLVFSDTSPSLICDILSQFVWMHELTHYFLN